MALRLTVISGQSADLGKKGSKVFGVHGGTLGRAPDNDWALPDPDRYLSGRHARIEYRNGGYWVVDTSSNGTFVNDAEDPVGNRNSHELKDGDRLRMGDFEMRVSIDASNDFPPDDSAIVAFDGIVSSSAARNSTDDDIDALLDVDSLLLREQPTGNSGAHPVTPVNAWGQAVESAAVSGGSSLLKQHVRAAAQARNETEAGARAAAGQAPAWSMATRRIEPYKNPLKGGVDSAELPGLQALCRGAGIDPASLPATVQPQVLQLAGQLLREVLMGLMENFQSRNELKNRFRVQQPAGQTTEANPLHLSTGVDEALVRLLESLGKSGRMSPVDAVRESFNEIRTHQQAMQAGMQEGFLEFFGRLDPEELQERFDRGLKRGGLLPSSNKSKYWELYAEFYQTLSQTPKGELPHVFAEEFAKAYAAKLAELNARRGR